MAKKIVLSGTEVTRASNALKNFLCEHVLVSYPAHKDRPEQKFIVVLNKNFLVAKQAIAEAELTILKVRNSRHYETLALKHQHYQPKFTCKCRHCGKTFTSHVKEAVWCSKKCKQDFRNAKKAKKEEDAA